MDEEDVYLMFLAIPLSRGKRLSTLDLKLERDVTSIPLENQPMSRSTLSIVVRVQTYYIGMCLQ